MNPPPPPQFGVEETAKLEADQWGAGAGADADADMPCFFGGVFWFYFAWSWGIGQLWVCLCYAMLCYGRYDWQYAFLVFACMGWRRRLGLTIDTVPP